MKELAYGASHEINNPLANIAARAQTLLRDEPDPERRRTLEAIHQQALRAHEMISDLMLFARPPKLQKAPVKVAALLGELVAETTPLCASRGIELTLAVTDESLSVAADRVQLAVAVKALLTNAVEALGREGKIEVEARAEGAKPRAAAIVVRDSGPGIAPQIAAKIFHPFFSGREAGRGLGFGLSKCWRVVTDHGGSVSATSPASGGAEFTIVLPQDAD